MKYLKQLIDHDPKNGRHGDCFRTVLACLLDFDSPAEVPHFMDAAAGDPKAVWDRVDDWLAQFGLGHITVAYIAKPDDVLATVGQLNPGLRYMIAGSSPRGVNHECIARGNAIEHDPSPHGGGLVGPCDDGFTWVTALVDRRVHL